MNDTQKSTESTTTGKTFEGFTAEERAAMKEHAQELKADARRGPRGNEPDAPLTGDEALVVPAVGERDVAQEVRGGLAAVRGVRADCDIDPVPG